MSTNVKNNQEKKNIILEVKDLRISFRTNEGVVKAVRGVSYDLEEGETLAIVGESGSGKSVSSRSIMGILAGNAIIDGGSIIYEGQDLLKLHEDEFHKIRGNKIGMIFQDPTSSLNPIMRVGKQIEEGMLVNGKRKKNKYRDLIKKNIKIMLMPNMIFTTIKQTIISRKNKKMIFADINLKLNKSMLIKVLVVPKKMN